MTKIPIKTKYYTEGYVIGDDWYDQRCTYPAERIAADTYDELVRKVNEEFEKGSLDSGFGFQRLVGFELEVYIISTVNINGLEFSRTDWSLTLSKNETNLMVD